MPKTKIAVLAAAALSAAVGIALAGTGPAVAQPNGAVGPVGNTTAAPANAPLSGRLVPGLRGAAAETAAGGPAGTARFLAARADLARHTGPAATVTPNLTPWTGLKHVWWGTFVSGVTPDGGQATQSVNPNAHLSGPGDGDTLYEPTFQPDGHSCIEVSTAAFGGGTDDIGAWDWCAPASQQGFKVLVPIDASFLSTYTTTVNGHPAYTVRTTRTNASTNSWTSAIFNVTTSSWDTLFTSTGTSGTAAMGGWDIDELYTGFNRATQQGFYCTDVSSAAWQSSGLQYHYAGAWHPATTANSTVAAVSTQTSARFGCTNRLTFTLNSTNDNFEVDRTSAH